MGIRVNRFKNESRGKRGTAKESLYFEADGSTGGSYDVTLNYDTGHFCSCRGMTSKIRKFGAVGTLDPRRDEHWCKHVKLARSPQAKALRLQAREIRNETFGIHESPVDPETGRSVASETTGRRAAVRHTRAKVKGARERLAEIEQEREKLEAEIAAEEAAGADKALASLIEAHGLDAIKAAVKRAS